MLPCGLGMPPCFICSFRTGVYEEMTFMSFPHPSHHRGLPVIGLTHGPAASSKLKCLPTLQPSPSFSSAPQHVHW
jgi:hypothetical protein